MNDAATIVGSEEEDSIQEDTTQVLSTEDDAATNVESGEKDSIQEDTTQVLSTEDERVFGNAQTASFNVNVIEVEDEQESENLNSVVDTMNEVETNNVHVDDEAENSDENKELDDNDDDDHLSGIESVAIIETTTSSQDTATERDTHEEVEDEMEVQIVTQHDEDPAATQEVYTLIEDEEMVDVEGDVEEISEPRDEINVAVDDSENANGDESSGVAFVTGGEESEGVGNESDELGRIESEAAIETSVISGNDTIGEVSPDSETQDEDGHIDEQVPDTEAQDGQQIDGTELDETSEVQTIIMDTSEVAYEAEEQGLVPIPDTMTEDDDLAVPTWQKATKAVASNKLVEEGLRRLQRKDGDVPSVPYVITRAMRQVLVSELGYDSPEVDEMRPDVAVVIVAESLERPELEELPTRFYNEIESAVAIEESHDDKSLKGTIVSLIHRFRDEVSNLLSGSDRQTLAIIVACLGVSLSVIFKSPNENKPLQEKGISISTVPSTIDTPSTSMSSDLSDIEDDIDDANTQQDLSYSSSSSSSPSPTAPTVHTDDLDKTWLDKLISLVSKPFGV